MINSEPRRFGQASFLQVPPSSFLAAPSPVFAMFDICIARGARLLMAPANSAVGASTDKAPSVRRVDVTHDAVAYLFDSVRLEEGVLLADVLGLLSACPVLRDVFARDFAHEYAAALAEAAPSPLGALPAPDGSLKRLEAYPVRHYNTAQHAEEAQSWQFHGIGPAPTEEGGSPLSTPCDAEDVPWGVSLGELGPLLALPVVISNQAVECEADAHSLRFGAALRRYRVAAPTLGELLHAVLYELSFHGGPAQRAETRKQIEELASEALEGVHSRGAETSAAVGEGQPTNSWAASSMLWIDSDRQAATRIFLPGHPEGDDALAHVFGVVRAAPDTEPACSILATQAPGWVLCEQFLGLNGRDLREAAFNAGLPPAALTAHATSPGPTGQPGPADAT